LGGRPGCEGGGEASSWMASSQAWHWLGDVYFEFMLKIFFFFSHLSFSPSANFAVELLSLPSFAVQLLFSTLLIISVTLTISQVAQDNVIRRFSALFFSFISG
jgi:hypothetical protein